MALVTKPKPPVHNRKRQARHHRRSKSYLKAYHPYLPVMAVVGASVLINHFLYKINPLSVGLLPGDQVVGATRIQVLTNQANWALPIVIIITAGAAVIFAVSHWYRFRRVISRGGTFLHHHSWFDVFLVAILAAGIILTRSA